MCFIYRVIKNNYMINWIKKIFSNNCKSHDGEIDRIISYYNKRLMKELEERKNFENLTIRKLQKYIDKLIEHGLYDFEE